MDIGRMRSLVAGARVGRLGTVDPAGLVHLVPFCFALVGDTVWSAVDAKPKATLALARLANIRHHPVVTVLVDQYEEDWSALWWVRLRGSGRVFESGPARDAGLAALAGKYAQYRASPPEGAVIGVDVTEWRGWAART